MDQAMSSNVFRYLRKGAFLPSELKQNVDKALEVRGSMVSLSEYRKKADLSDIDEKTRQVEELQTRLRKLTDHAKDMIVWLDAGLHLRLQHCRSGEDAGICPGQPSGTKLSWDDIIYADDRNVLDKLRRLIRERAERDEGEVRVFRVEAGSPSLLPRLPRLRRPWGACRDRHRGRGHHPAEGGRTGAQERQQQRSRNSTSVSQAA